MVTRSKVRLSDKYLAGMLDSDGCIALVWNPPLQRREEEGLQRAYATVQFSQKTPDMSFMHLIANSLTPPSLEQVWGSFRTSPSGAHYWVTAGTKATSVLMRLKKYLVLKRALADCAIEMNGKAMNVEEGKRRFDAARTASPMPKHPTRKWVAGYLDGNANFHVYVRDGMSATVSLRVNDEAFERVGLDLLQKAFGGSCREYVIPSGNKMVEWQLSMDTAKVRSMFESDRGGIAKHMTLKTDQVYFLLGCARFGHWRDGERIQAGVEQLRSTYPLHRLTGPGAEVAKLLTTVRDLPERRGRKAQVIVEAA
jgi:hypothetical protein